jgi:outer membrane lipoprotein-sorting protein
LIVLRTLLIVIALFILSNIALATEKITLDELLINMEKTLDSVNDYSCTHVNYGSDAYKDKLKAMFEKRWNMPMTQLPKESKLLLWVKKPFMMRTESPIEFGLTIITSRKEGEEYISESWLKPINTFTIQKSDKYWPQYPSIEVVLLLIKRLKKELRPFTIEKKEKQDGGIYILTLISKELGRKDYFYIRESDWFIYKHVVDFGNNEISTSEWRNIEINKNIPDSFFKQEIPEGAKVEIKDETKD